ncbi:hypothetical protein V491_01779 [Pseudogymnoascus sp. VKM F-3775]|nr:hypothetical protein V491_01779 [Pseudogymnoascus sp. VKM F-3775]
MKASFALPAVGNNAAAAVGSLTEKDTLVKRDDEWTLVLYNAGESGGQCGGTSTSQSGGADSCVSIPSGKFCADVKVTAGLPNIAACAFNFKYDGAGCNGESARREVVGIGADSNGIPLTDDVKFVSISCYAEG